MRGRYLAVALCATAACSVGDSLPDGPEVSLAGSSCVHQVGALPDATVAGDLAGLRSKVQHIVLIVQENRSFDHLFSRHPRTRESCATSDHGCLEGYGSWTDRSGGAPVRATTAKLGDPQHTWDAMHRAFDDGRQDNFFDSTGPQPDPAAAISYYLEQDHPFYSWLVTQFATSDSYYAALLGPTWPDRDYLIWGSSFGMTDNTAAPPAGDAASTTDQGIFTQLRAANVSYKLYWSPSDGHAIQLPYEGALGWNEPAGGVHCTPGSVYCTTPLADFERDLEQGTLPSVSYVESSNDEHPGDSDLHEGEASVRDAVAAVVRSRYWDSTLVIVTYDEGGGFFDHKRPPLGCDELEAFSQRGFRVPLVIVSPYAKSGYASHEVNDHASVLRLVQARWNLPALSLRNANADALLDLLDFDARPRVAPRVVPSSGLAGDAPGDRALATSLWNDQLPISDSSSSPGAFELGVRFLSDLAMPRVVGIKYWVGDRPELGVAHTGRVWDAATGALVASVTFPDETEATAGTWQVAYFDAPVPIATHHVYIASRNTHLGGIPKTRDYFRAPALPAPAQQGNVVTCASSSMCASGFGPSSVYANGEGHLPTIDPQGTNYWVDVLVK